MRNIAKAHIHMNFTSINQDINPIISSLFIGQKCYMVG